MVSPSPCDLIERSRWLTRNSLIPLSLPNVSTVTVFCLRILDRCIALPSVPSSAIILPPSNTFVLVTQCGESEDPSQFSPFLSYATGYYSPVLILFTQSVSYLRTVHTIILETLCQLLRSQFDHVASFPFYFIHFHCNFEISLIFHLNNNN